MKTLLAILLAAAPPELLAQSFRFGLPACQAPSAELAGRRYFVLCHDSSLLVPSWTAHLLTPGRLGGAAPRPRRFRTDAALTGPASKDADYRGTGWTRGHFVPAEDMAFSGDAIRATFLLSNAAPQLPSVNAGNWRRIENAVRVVASQTEEVHVVTGPIFAARPIQFSGRVAVPTHFFKVWLAIQDGHRRIYAAIVPNAAVCKESIDDFAVSVDEVERLTGLDFFPALEDEEEQRLESAIEALPAPRRTRACAP